MSFDQVFNFRGITNSYIFRYDDLQDMLDAFDLTFEEFQELAAKLQLVKNLTANKSAYKAGYLTLASGLKLKFNRQTFSLDDLRVTDVREDGSNTVVSILGFPLKPGQAAQLTKIDRFAKMPKDVIRELAINLEPNDLVNFCQTSKRMYETVCNSQDFWWRKLQKDYPMVTDLYGGTAEEIYKGLTTTIDLKNFTLTDNAFFDISWDITSPVENMKFRAAGVHDRNLASFEIPPLMQVILNLEFIENVTLSLTVYNEDVEDFVIEEIYIEHPTFMKVAREVSKWYLGENMRYHNFQGFKMARGPGAVYYIHLD